MSKSNDIYTDEIRKKQYSQDELDSYSRWLAETLELPMIENQYYQGEKGALLDAIAVCMRENIGSPDWLRTAFLHSYGRIKRFDSKSWDDVFGKPHPKGTNLAAKKKRLELKMGIYIEIKKSERPIDSQLFDDVGAKFGIGKTLAQEIYYKNKKSLDIFFSSASDELFEDLGLVSYKHLFRQA